VTGWRDGRKKQLVYVRVFVYIVQECMHGLGGDLLPPAVDRYCLFVFIWFPFICSL